jgi:hypothetical protein
LSYKHNLNGGRYVTSVELGAGISGPAIVQIASKFQTLRTEQLFWGNEYPRKIISVEEGTGRE